MRKHLLFFSVLTQFYLFISLSAVRVQFYYHVNFTGLVYESSSTANCTNFPKNGLIHAKSVKTNTCMWAYNYPNCDSQHWFKKYVKDTTSTTSSIGTVYHFGSFHFCNETKIEQQLNIDITPHYTGKHLDLPVLHRYNSVCSCMNVPSDIENISKWSINSNGNDFVGYFEQNCSEHKWPSIYFEANSWKSVNMHDHIQTDNKTKYAIRSFGPTSNSTYFKTSCSFYYMYSWIMQLENLETGRNSSLHLNSISSNGIENNQLSERDTGRIVFFSQPNFRGIHLETSLKTGCHNLQGFDNSNERNSDTGSIKASTCVMIYSNDVCSGRSLKIPPGETTNLIRMWESTLTGIQTISSLYSKFPNWKWNTGSFRACNDNVESSELNVDIIEYYPDYTTFTTPVVYERFRSVCSCQNIPYNVQIMDTWSIDNHENSMIAYFEYDCKSKPLTPLWIPAGRSSYSMGFGELRKVDKNTGISQKVQSFGPDPDSEYFKISCAAAESGSINQETVSNIGTAPVVNPFASRLRAMEYLLQNYTKSFEKRFQELQDKHSKDLKNLTDKISELEKHESEYHNLLNKVQQPNR